MGGKSNLYQKKCSHNSHFFSQGLIFEFSHTLILNMSFFYLPLFNFYCGVRKKPLLILIFHFIYISDSFDNLVRYFSDTLAVKIVCLGRVLAGPRTRKRQ